MAKSPTIAEMAIQLRQNLEAIAKRIEQKQIERHQVEMAPRPKDEVMAEILAYFDQQAREYAGSILNQFQSAKSPRSTGVGRLLHPAGPRLEADSRAVIWLLRPLLEERLHDVLKDDPIYSGEETGLNHAERQEKLAQIDAEITELKVQQQTIVNELSSAGIQVFL